MSPFLPGISIHTAPMLVSKSILIVPLLPHVYILAVPLSPKQINSFLEIFESHFTTVLTTSAPDTTTVSNKVKKRFQY